MDTSMEWAQYAMGLNMEEDCQELSCIANAQNNDKLSSCAVLQSIQKDAWPLFILTLFSEVANTVLGIA